MGLSHYLSRYRVDISEEELLRLRRAIHSVLLGIDRANAIQLADMLAALPYPLAFAYLELLQPVLYSLGDEWAAGAITPMRVQIASSLANSMLATLYHRRVNGTPLTNPAIVVCAAAGNLHELGSRMVADLLEEAHYQTIVIAPPGCTRPAAGICRKTSPRRAGALRGTSRAHCRNPHCRVELRRDGYMGLIAAGGFALWDCPPDQLLGTGIDWCDSDVLAFIHWLDEQPLTTKRSTS